VHTYIYIIYIYTFNSADKPNKNMFCVSPWNSHLLPKALEARAAPFATTARWKKERVAHPMAMDALPGRLGKDGEEFCTMQLKDVETLETTYSYGCK
jgi:hypothetical protein